MKALVTERDDWLSDLKGLSPSDQVRVIAQLHARTEEHERGMAALRDAARSQVDVQLEEGLSKAASRLTLVGYVLSGILTLVAAYLGS